MTPAGPRPRVVFFGTSEFAVPSLMALAVHADVRLVVTQPQRPSGRGHRTLPTPVKAAAIGLRLATAEPQRLRDALPALRLQGADVFAVASYGKIVPQPVLDLPRVAALNVHPSLLPLYRGATPLQSVLRDHRPESGVSIIAMDAGMDTGDVVLRERTPVGDDETYGELHDRYASLGAALLVRAVDAAVRGALVRVPQDEMGYSPEEIAATLTRPLRKEDLVVDWSWPALHIVDHVRSLSPRPLARATVGGEVVKIVRAHVAGEGERGARAALQAGDGRGVVLDTVVPPNRGPMSGESFLRGHAGA